MTHRMRCARACLPSIVVVALVTAVLAATPVAAQQKIGFVDSEYVLEKIPEFATIEQNIDRKRQEWEQELQESQESVDELFREYQARELLYTREERNRKREEIVRAEEDLNRLRMKYFGPEGELFVQQETQLRPLQEKVLKAIEQVAARDGFDYVFDKSGDIVFLFAREQNNLSDKVLEELGIDIEQSGSSRP